MCLAAHDLEFRRWPGGVDRRICQTFAASPAEPGNSYWGLARAHEPFAAVRSGSLRTRFPVAANTALTMAGAIAAVPGSPIPPGASLLSVK